MGTAGDFEHVPRRLAEVVTRRLGEEPVVALHGPRTVGKSTLLDEVALTHGQDRLDLDDPATRQAVEGDPGLFAGGPSPVCIDEYQHVPSVLDAIKAELNRDLRPGRFVLTGSTTYASLPLTAQSLTGRLHRLTVWPLSQGELAGVRERFVEALLDDPASLVSRAASTTTREDYIERIVAGGFPLALRRRGEVARSRWFDDFVALVVERDVMELTRVRQREALPRLLGELAGQTAGLLSVASAARRVGIEPSTAENYTKLLEAAYLIYRLPAWGRTLSSRVGATPKVHVVDSGLAARLLRLTSSRLGRRAPAALTELGHLLETFVVNEILKQLSWLDTTATAAHFRTRDGVEVDLVLERDDGALLGIEIKTGPRVSNTDLAGLRALKRGFGDDFLGGVILNLGQHSYTAEPGIHVLPVDRLWTL